MKPLGLLKRGVAGVAGIERVAWAVGAVAEVAVAADIEVATEKVGGFGKAVDSE